MCDNALIAKQLTGKKMLKLRQIDGGQTFTYQGNCLTCNEEFIYKSSNGIVRHLWDKYLFDVDFKTHEICCVSKQIEEAIQKKRGYI